MVSRPNLRLVSAGGPNLDAGEAGSSRKKRGPPFKWNWEEYRSAVYSHFDYYLSMNHEYGRGQHKRAIYVLRDAVDELGSPVPSFARASVIVRRFRNDWLREHGL